MEITSIIGILGGIAVVVLGILESGDLSGYWNLPSVFIVVGGLAFATVLSYPMDVLKSLVKVVANVFKAKRGSISEDIEKVIQIANIARSEGILALEDFVADMDDPFLKKGVMLIVDGSDPELVRGIMETELDSIVERHTEGQAVLLQMSAYSPAFGMIGTLIGLINMLAKLSDMDSLAGNMATALVTTFYGSALANMLFTPMARKLGNMTAKERLRKEIILEGILSIQDGENPRVIREKLNAFLPDYQLVQAASQDLNSARAERPGAA